MTNAGGDRATAYHEAGHAVAAVLLHVRGPIREVTIVPDDPYNDGEVRFLYPNREPRRCEVDHWILQCVAGRWAECRYQGGDNPGGAEGDYERCVTWAVRCGIATNADFEKEFDSPFWARHDARGGRFVRRNWNQIQAVAEALFEEKTISGARVAGLLGRWRVLRGHAWVTWRTLSGPWRYIAR